MDYFDNVFVLGGAEEFVKRDKFHFKDRVILLDFAHSFINCLYKRINEMVHIIKWYIMAWVSACEKCAIFKNKMTVFLLAEYQFFTGQW